MDNPETLATWGTRDTGCRWTKQIKKHNTENKKDEQHGSNQTKSVW